MADSETKNDESTQMNGGQNGANGHDMNGINGMNGNSNGNSNNNDIINDDDNDSDGTTHEINDDNDTEYNTDPDYTSDNKDNASNMDDDDDTLSQGSHARSHSFHERRDSIKKEQEEMQQKIVRLQTMMNVEASTAAQEEMQRIAEDKELFNKIFDKIDPDDNGDVDLGEWSSGVNKANIGVTEVEAIRIFRLMDEDNEGYIDRNDWITFCMTAFQTKEIIQLQYDVLSKIKGHTRKPSNLFRKDQGDWKNADITELQNEMQREMIKQIDEQKKKAADEENFYNEIERKINEDPNFGKTSRATEWNPQEVAWWLDSIEMGQYSRQFAEDQVDGEMLLNDCNRNLLTNDMNIKPLHVGKILREIDRLRSENSEFLQSPYLDWNTLNDDNKELKKKLDKANKLVNELETENNNLKLEIATSAIQYNEENKGSLNDNAGLYDNILIDNSNENNISVIKNNENSNTGGTNKGKDQIIYELQMEIERIKYDKILLAKNADNEISSLRKICKIISHEYNKQLTPKYKIKNPIDILLNQFGYAKQN